jgi:hypothetical protein
VRNFLIRTPHQILVEDKIEEDEMGVACSMYWEKRNLYRILVGKPDGKRPLEKPSFTWRNNIKMYLQVIGLGGLNLIYVALTDCCESGNEHPGSIKCGRFLYEPRNC